MQAWEDVMRNTTPPLMPSIGLTFDVPQIMDDDEFLAVGEAALSSRAASLRHAASS